MSFRNILLTTAVTVLALGHSLAWAADSGRFTFNVFGDSRLPGNMNFNNSQQLQIADYITNNFNGMTIDQVALRYDDQGHLSGLRVPKTGEPSKDITLDGHGWPATIIDTKQKPSLTLRKEGLGWVYESVIDAVGREGNQGFVLHTGDISYNGYYGTDPTSVYWNDFKKRLLDRLPAGEPDGLPGRFYPAVGNHETWLDPAMEGLRNTVPYLAALKVAADRHIYMFDYNGSRFIFLDTGGYEPPAGWGADSQPGYAEQMSQLQTWLADAQQKQLGHVFITLHKPPFCGAGHGHLEAKQNPHDLLVPFATDKKQPLDITVFSGHVHSSEMYYKDTIRYLVLGGGGADQVYTTACLDGDPYCQDELYWHGEPRQMEFNYLTVVVNGADIRFKMNRWRPDAAIPKQTCLIDKQLQIGDCIEQD